MKTTVHLPRPTGTGEPERIGVLLIRDGMISSKALAAMIRRQGAAVTIAQGPHETNAQLAASEGVDVAVMDIRARPALRRTVQTALGARDVPIPVFVIGHESDLPSLAETVREGCQGFFIHPLQSLHDIAALLDHHGRNHRILSETRSYQTNLRQVLRYRETAAEEERRRIGAVLHDELAQSLTAGIFAVNHVQNAIRNGREIQPERLDSIVHMLQSTIQTVRNMTATLQPPFQAGRIDMGPCIKQEVSRFNNVFGLKVNVAGDFGSEEDWDLPRATATLRVLQEALFNVVKHAGASAVRVQGRTEGGVARFSVSDNGIGISRGAERDPSARGITIMRERLLAFGGNLLIRKRPQGGTSVTLDIPMKSSPQTTERELEANALRTRPVKLPRRKKQ